MKVLWNEEIVDESEVKIDIEDRGYQFGDGIYEVIRIYDGYMYMEKEHLDRLGSVLKNSHDTSIYKRRIKSASASPSTRSWT